MGRGSRRTGQTPARLAEKLLQIRAKLGLSQNQMIRRLGFEGELIQSHISAYEQENEKLRRVPPPGVLLSYARAANVFVETLIDDELDLPDKLPASPKSEGVKRAPKELSKRPGGNDKRIR